MFWLLLGFLAFHLLFAGRRAGSRRDFFIAGGDRSWMQVAFSLSATALGASAILGTAGWGYRFGMWGGLWLWAGSAGLLLLAVLVPFVPYGRNHLTLPHLLSTQAGAVGRRITAAVLILPWIAITAAQFRAIAAILAPHTALGLVPLMGLTALFVSAYLYRGGQRAVYSSDRVQLFVLVLGIVVGLGLLCTVRGGSSLPAPEYVFTERIGLLGLLPVVLSYLIGPDIHSRLLGTDCPASRRRALLLSALIVAAVGAAMAFIGWNARAIANGGTPDSVLPQLISRTGFWLGGLLNMAILAALISSADTTLFSAASMLAVDLLNKDQRHTRIAIPVLALAAVAIGAMESGIIPLMFIAYDLFVGILGPLIVWALFLRVPVSERWLLATLLTGALCFLGFRVSGVPHTALFSFISGSVVLGLGCAASRGATRVSPR